MKESPRSSLDGLDERKGGKPLAEPVAERCDMIADRLQYKPDCSGRWHIKHGSTQVVNQLAAARKHLLP